MPDRKDIFIIEIDERDIGGSLRRIATFENEPAARREWDKLAPPETGKQYWLCRITGGIDDPAHCSAIDFKGAEGD